MPVMRVHLGRVCIPLGGARILEEHFKAGSEWLESDGAKKVLEGAQALCAASRVRPYRTSPRIGAFSAIAMCIRN